MIEDGPAGALPAGPFFLLIRKSRRFSRGDAEGAETRRARRRGEKTASDDHRHSDTESGNTVVDFLIPNPGKESDYRGTGHCQKNRDERIPLFLWLLSVPLYPSSVVFPDSV
jgi:hypothetical protein